MKIFNVEDGNKKVYVQIQDLIDLYKYENNVPENIISRSNYLAYDCELDGNAKAEFIEFNDPKIVEYFEKIDWIIDYKKERELTVSELNEKAKKLEHDRRVMYSNYEEIHDEVKDHVDVNEMMNEYDKIMHKENELFMLAALKDNKIDLNFPLAIDSDGFNFVGDEECIYKISGSLDPYKIILYKKDGSNLDLHDKVPLGFFEMGMAIAVTERNNKSFVMGDYKTKTSLTPDNKYFVIEYRINELKQEKEDNKEDSIQEEVKEDKGIKRLIKRFFNKNVK